MFIRFLKIIKNRMKIITNLKKTVQKFLYDLSNRFFGSDCLKKSILSEESNIPRHNKYRINHVGEKNFRKKFLFRPLMNNINFPIAELHRSLQ